MTSDDDLRTIQIRNQEEWIDVEVLVRSVDDNPDINSAKQTGTITDGENDAEFISWEASDQPRVESGKHYRINNLFLDDSGDFIFRSDTEITELDDRELDPIQHVLTATANHSNNDYVNVLYLTPVFYRAFHPFENRNRIGDPVRERSLCPRRVDPRINIHPDGIELSFKSVYRTDLHEDKLGEGITDAWDYEKREFEKEQEFLAKFRDIDGLTVETEGEFELTNIEICPSCGERVPKSPDSCYECDTEETESATIHKEISIHGIIEVPHTTDGFKQFARKLSARFRFSPAKAFDLIGADVANTTTIDNIAGQYYQSDNYGAPSTVYHSLHIGYETDDITTDTADDIRTRVSEAFTRLDAFEIGVSSAEKRSTKSTTTEGTDFIVFETGSMSSDSLWYSDFWDAVDEVKEDDYKSKCVLVLPNDPVWDDVLDDKIQERVDANLNLVSDWNNIPHTSEYHVSRLYNYLFGEHSDAFSH